MSFEFRPGLTIANGQLLSGTGRGTEVHAACFLPQRKVTLDTDLIERPRELRRIVAHEVFHFVWWRLGNPRREEWDSILTRERREGARGELGYSADVLKEGLKPADWKRLSLRWRHYRCESFCDSAAWFFCRGLHSEYTLAPRFRRRRQAFFESLLDGGPLSI